MSTHTTAEPRVARVVIDVRTRALDEPFDYAVPDALAGSVALGCPVLVPLGSRRAVGFVVGLCHESAYKNLKPIEAVLGESLSRTDAYELARWIADEYAAPLADAMALFLPPGGTPKVVRREAEGEVTWELVRPSVSAAEDKVVTLLDPDFEPKAGARLQRSIIDALRMGPVTSGELSAELGAVSSALKTLETRGAVEVTARRRWRGEAGRVREDTSHELTPAQAAAVETITQEHGNVVVLEGVTGSGKTEVYLRAIESTLAGGRDAIVLVPEISLTPQTVGRFRARFGNLVAVLHSRLSVGERFDQWSLAAEGQARVVVGARSALFAPLPNLGLVIIDEEHESSYKQGSAPRYHARDVAAHMAKSSDVTVVLGTATPSLEARVKAEDGEWLSAKLPERVTAHGLPEVKIVDMGAEFSGGNRSMFSVSLTNALNELVAKKSKGVLFLNRRGFASFLLCRECGYVPRCENCSVSLTYHERGDRLACHHCGHTEPSPVLCPRCQSPYLRKFGAGTQRVEDEIHAQWPDLPVVRMDADTTSGKGGHERALSAFEDMESGLLLGTQMVAKGLDYPEVTLVGVINADTTMHLPDFRAAERTYQLLEQVSGRAGRGEDPGLVVIQTYWPDHPAILAVAARNADLLYGEERELRSAIGWAPYRRIANIVVSGETASSVKTYSDTLGQALKAAIAEDWEVLGPSEAALARVKRAYRRHVVVKAPPGSAMGQLVRKVLSENPAPPGVAVAPDIDPVDFL